MAQDFLMMISLTPSLSSGFFLFVCLPPFHTHTHTHTNTYTFTYAPTHMHAWPNNETFWSTNLWYHNKTLHALHTLHLRNLHAGQEATVRTGHRTTDWFQIGKGVPQGCILSPCLFNFYAEYIMRNAGQEEAQAGIKIAGRNRKTSDMQITPPLWQKVKRN